MKKLRIAFIAMAALIVAAGALFGGLYLWAQAGPPPLYVRYNLPDGEQTRHGMRSSYTYRMSSVDGFCLGTQPEYFNDPYYAYCTITATPGTQLRFIAAKTAWPGARLDKRLRTPAVQTELADCAVNNDHYGYPYLELEYLEYTRAANSRSFTLAVPEKPPGYYILRFSVNYQMDWFGQLLNFFDLLGVQHVTYYFYLYIENI